MSDVTTAPVETKKTSVELPALGFLGVGWIGRDRMQAIVNSGAARVLAAADPEQETAEGAVDGIKGAVACESLDDLLELDLDAVVIATPSALHTDQTVKALEAGKAVFCQKPLGRSKGENAAAVKAARDADRLLGVDFSYRCLDGMQQIKRLIDDGAIGQIYASNLVFHNAYGPDKDWFYDPVQSGGGCVVDLGIHLVDLLLWSLDFPEVAAVSSNLYCNGQAVRNPQAQIEDYALAQIRLSNGVSAQLACSWNLSAGRDAVIEATFYGTEGALTLHNDNGSFFDFTAELYRGTSREILSSEGEGWGGRAAVQWAEQLKDNPSFDPGIEHVVRVADVLDAVYGRKPAGKL